ncbi:MAG: caspase family protein [Saprospirales bacterium]|nr:caspase family protein [Saprospirales bacterium]
MSQPKRGIGAYHPDQGPGSGLARGKNYLLAIGIDKYLHFPQLNNAVRDAETFAALLQERYQFDVRNTEVLFNEQATERQLIFKLRDMARLVTPEDNLIIYFSGHGAFDDVLNEGYWIPVDAERDAIEDFVPNSKIHTVLNAIHSRHTFLIIDSCFSGSLFMQYRSAGGEDRLEALPSRWGLSSGRNEVVPDGPSGEHSPFAESLLKQLTLNDGELGVGELCQRVVESVAARSQQIPRGEPLRVDGHEGGQFFFRLREQHKSGDAKQEPAAAGATQGGLLYSIPRAMEVGQESRCEVRVAFDKAFLMKDFDPGKESKVRDIRISNLMQVELLDPLLGGMGAFTIRTISSAEQFIDPGDYTQWIFYVKALLAGNHPLVLKVTVIETMDGRERRKDMVMEETIQVLSRMPLEEPETEGFVSGYTFTLGPEAPAAEALPQPAPFAPPAPAPAPSTRAGGGPPIKKASKRRFTWVPTVAGLLTLVFAAVVVVQLMIQPNKSVESPSPVDDEKSFPHISLPIAEARKLLEAEQPDIKKAEELIETARRSTEQKEVIPEDLIKELEAVEQLLKEKKELEVPQKQNIETKKNLLSDRTKSPGIKAPAEEGQKTPPENFTDQRDGKKYPAIKLAGKFWLQRNLAYQTEKMTCYANSPLMCENLGALYTWDDARRSCPNGWRLPDKKEWDALVGSQGGYESNKSFQSLQYGGGAFFQAQLAGMQLPKGEFSGLYEEGYFWTSTPSGGRSAMAVVFDKKTKSVKIVPVDRRAKLSCRCVKE